jgi:hypothetical protein
MDIAMSHNERRSGIERNALLEEIAAAVLRCQKALVAGAKRPGRERADA